MTISASRISNEPIRWDSFDTVNGRIYAAVSQRGLCRLTWHMSDDGAFESDLSLRFPGHPIVRDTGGLMQVGRELEDYFAGKRRNFDIPVDLSSFTDFERSVLEATRRVPFGAKVTYSELAKRIDRPKAARAVGNALRHNPVPLVVPCHRVVRADGTLGGYGGPAGTAEKEGLLRRESVN